MPKNQLVNRALDWLKRSNGTNFLTDEEHCPTRDIFQARLDKVRLLLEKELGQKDLIYLLIAIIGKIGNNAFDHNLGAWRDTPGVYFAYDLESKIVVIADRGQGIFKTIKRVKPSIKNDKEAVQAAFTETISGRSPEKRGNGLKFVAKVAAEYPIAVNLWSGNAYAKVNHDGLKVESDSDSIEGTLAEITY